MSTWRVRRLAPLRFTNPRAAELSVHSTIVPSEHLHNLRSTNQRHQLGFTRTQTNHVLLLGRRIHGIPRVFNRTFDPNCNSRIAATVFDVSIPISVGHHHYRTLRTARNTRNIKIATNDHVACRISHQISQQTLDVDFITSGIGQLTNCVLDVKTIQPE